jgi:hypothetical protein
MYNERFLRYYYADVCYVHFFFFDAISVLYALYNDTPCILEHFCTLITGRMASSQSVNVPYTPVAVARAHQPIFQCLHCVRRCYSKAGLKNHVRAMHGSQATSTSDRASPTSASQHSNTEGEHPMDVDFDLQPLPAFPDAYNDDEFEGYGYNNGSDMEINDENIHDNNSPTGSSGSESLSALSAGVHVSESSSQHSDNEEEHHMDVDLDVQPLQAFPDAYHDDDHNRHDNNSTSSGSGSPPIIPSSPQHEFRPHEHQQKPANDRFLRRVYHDKLNGQKCDQHGVNIAENTPPPPRESDHGPDNWMPYAGRVEFELAEFIYQRNQMSAPDIDTLLNLWNASAAENGGSAPFQNHKHLYDTIDATPLGDVPWETFSLKFNGDKPEGDAPPWMDASYDVWFRDPRKLVHNIISNPDFEKGFDYTPYQEHNSDHDRRYHNFMSANWSWKQAVCNTMIWSLTYN